MGRKPKYAIRIDGEWMFALSHKQMTDICGQLAKTGEYESVAVYNCDTSECIFEDEKPRKIGYKLY